MNKPMLIVMAAGLGSRYGGLKQIEPVDENGHILMDYSIFDAKRAGFETAVCVLGAGMERDFRALYGNRINRCIELKTATQTLDDLPGGYTIPEGRVKPWGTAHAVLSAREYVGGPFAVINADDFYGVDAFKAIYGFLAERAGESHHAMVGYRLENTLTENGHVARGVCRESGGKLIEIIENTRIEKRDGGAESFFDNGSSVFLPGGTTVSMNLWGFSESMIGETEKSFRVFLEENLSKNPLKAEYFLPWVTNELMRGGKAEISVLKTMEKWYGVTYAADMPVVRAALKDMRNAGKYPELLWGDKQ